MKAIEQEIKQHNNKNIPGEMEKLKEANEKLSERQKQIAEEKELLATKIDALKDEIAKQEVRTFGMSGYYWTEESVSYWDGNTNSEQFTMKLN